MKKLLQLLFLPAAVLMLEGCKDDPKPLQAEVNGKLLAGEKGQSKGWKIVSISAQSGSTNQTYTLSGCFTDNVYTFHNEDTQEYAANEGTSKCGDSSPDLIEKGTWSFTLDGLYLNVGCDEIYSLNGLFSPDAVITILATDEQGNVMVDDDGNAISYPLTLTYPYPALVTKLTDSQMVLEMNNTVASNSVKYTLTFIPI